MIEHTGNTCSVGQTCLAFNRASKDEVAVLEGFGFLINRDVERNITSCYVHCPIATFVPIKNALVVACEIAGVKYKLPLRPDYANVICRYSSASKALEFDKEIGKGN